MLDTTPTSQRSRVHLIEVLFNGRPFKYQSIEFRDDGYVYVVDEIGSKIEKCAIEDTRFINGKAVFHLQLIQ